MHARAQLILVLAALLEGCGSLQKFAASHAILRAGWLADAIQRAGALVAWLLDALMSGFGSGGRCTITSEDPDDASAGVPVSAERDSCPTGSTLLSPSTNPCKEDT